jgi:hypothetical protein
MAASYRQMQVNLKEVEIMNEVINTVLKLIRGSMNALKFEEWVYSYKNLEEELSPNIYLKIISINFNKRDEVYKLIAEIKEWLINKGIVKCDCSFWKDNEKINLGYETANLLDSFQIKKSLTPWIHIGYCIVCNQAWNIAVDTNDDDYYFVRLMDDEVKSIEKDIWPNYFNKMENVWPCQEWLTIEVDAEQKHNIDENIIKPKTKSFQKLVKLCIAWIIRNILLDIKL